MAIKFVPFGKSGVVVVGLVLSYDLESYAGGGVAAGRVCCAGQVK